MATKSTKLEVASIRQFIVDNVESHPDRLAALVAKQFGISRQAANRYLRNMESEGILSSTGKTRNRKYQLKPEADILFELSLTPRVKEDIVWSKQILPALITLPANVLRICEYGFTEILNNAVDHSEGESVLINIQFNRRIVNLMINDDGIGIFKKIQRERNLDDPRHSILELAKGKMTTDPRHHTGEGIFFTSRAFDKFSMKSGTLYFSHTESDNDWLLETAEETKGTKVNMTISRDAERTIKQVFDKYASPNQEYSFSRTHVPVSLMRVGQENLISRSQAKRLLTRFDRFSEVLLDFTDVDTVGQAFADEIFRVFAREHPQVKIVWINANSEVESMIIRASANK